MNPSYPVPEGYVLVPQGDLNPAEGTAGDTGICPSPLRDAINELHVTQELLRNIILGLSNRLEPLLNPCALTKRMVEEKIAERSPLVSNVQELNGLFKQRLEELCELLQRLEV